MDEFIKSIKAFLYDRTVSPLFGAYISAWSVWNYKVFIVLLDGKADLSTKLDLLDKYFGPQIHIVGNTLYISGWFYSGIFWPTLLTLFYLFGYPKLAKPVYETSLQNQIELREAKQKKEKLRLLTVAESEKIQKEIEQLRARTEKEAMEYRARISSLTETITALEAEKYTEQPKNLAGSTDVNKFNPEELSNTVRSSIAALPVGEFQLSDLFEPDAWQEISESTRKEYGKSFRKLVERGDFDDVSLSRKGSANQLIYLKNTGSMFNELAEFEDFLISKIRQEYFPQMNELDQQRIELLKKIADYCVKNRISRQMFEVFLEVVFVGAEVQKTHVERVLSNKLSSIELDVVIDKLKESDLLTRDSFSTLKLSSKGKEKAVESGLTALNKTLS